MDFLVKRFNKHNKRMSVFLSESFDVLFEEKIIISRCQPGMKFEGEKQQATCMSDGKVCYFHHYGDLYSDQLVLTLPISLSSEHSENPSS